VWSKTNLMAMDFLPFCIEQNMPHVPRSAVKPYAQCCRVALHQQHVHPLTDIIITYLSIRHLDTFAEIPRRTRNFISASARYVIICVFVKVECRSNIFCGGTVSPVICCAYFAIHKVNHNITFNLSKANDIRLFQ
jgi:hypothetical protein